MKNKEGFGLEVILDLYGCDPEVIRSRKALSDFVIKMCKLLDMKRFGKTLMPHFGHNNPVTSGFSLLQFIETSSITGHFSELWSSAYINIFSCRMFDTKKAVDFTKKYFKAKRVNARTIIRS
jgi:S-adenosylmethionine/arginine decarboxylase-like enzyme